MCVCVRAVSNKEGTVRSDGRVKLFHCPVVAASCAVTLKHCTLPEKIIFRFLMLLGSINNSCLHIGMALISWSLQKRDTASCNT